MQQLIKFQPIYQERVWGGRELAGVFSRELPAGGPIGESWEIVDRPEAQSKVLGGPLNGLTLRAVIEQHGEAVMGPSWPKNRPFPILVKWLDCRDRLSLQVHPPASIAPELGGEPKTENWFIASATPEASLIVGLKRGVSREQFEQALRANTLESCVHRFPILAGDSILVRSGQIHAIDGGNLILEIQQNSDTTYRVYDWGRLGLDGKPRQMHVNESLRSIKWDDFEPTPVRADNREAVIADAKEFRIRRVPLAKSARLQIAAREQPRILSVVSGQVRLVVANGNGSGAESLKPGANVLLPFETQFDCEATECAVLLVTENFC
ncbi:MAG: class I mannose-6-phosphate isomerase [Verrucomicrobia bacterium]|nr:class I mannose-6-phosphate isomerase [Verrucomicrobiota bacterium]